MAKIIRFENHDGVKYKTPVIEDSGGVYRRPSVIQVDEHIRSNYSELTKKIKKKKKSKKRYT